VDTIRHLIALAVASLTGAAVFFPFWLLSNAGTPGIEILGTLLGIWTCAAAALTAYDHLY
jgi:hypothetical protein